ncbi:hypothetical protein B0H13DRAFT_1891119 [Mycena leptocephala]|nr:hypothetical protein B0H13DRAFT_1891119 [Mycena leptocephala]
MGGRGKWNGIGIKEVVFDTPAALRSSRVADLDDRGKEWLKFHRIGIKEVVFGDLRQADTPAALRYASRQKITKFIGLTWFDSLILMTTRGSWRGENSEKQTAEGGELTRNIRPRIAENIQKLTKNEIKPFEASQDAKPTLGMDSWELARREKQKAEGGGFKVDQEHSASRSVQAQSCLKNQSSHPRNVREMNIDDVATGGAVGALRKHYPPNDGAQL